MQYRIKKRMPLRVLVNLALAFLYLSNIAATRPFTVVIDPGHGGKDKGAVYRDRKSKTKSLYTEKEIALLLAQEVAAHLKKKGIKTVLTRNDDTLLPLPKRTELANKLKADIFISLHMNATPKGMNPKDIEGMETYVLNHSTDESSRRLADLENSGSGVAGSWIQPSMQRDVALILKDLVLDSNLKESQHLACAIQEHVVRTSWKKGPRLTRNRGVRQGLFYVLLGADMPSVLVEVGFLNNKKDRQTLFSKKGRARIALSMASAIHQYKKDRGKSRANKTLRRCKIN